MLGTLMGTIKLRQVHTNEHRVIRRCWSRCLQKTKTKCLYSPELSLALLEELPHGEQWGRIEEWEQAGVTKIGDLYRDGELLTFEDFITEWDIPQGPFLLYVAVTGAMRVHWGAGTTEPPTHATCKYIGLAGGTIKAVTCLNRAVRHNSTHPLQELRTKWGGGDLGRPLEDKDWENILQRATKVSHNARFRLIGFYILHSAYITPDRIHQFFHREDAECPRCRENGANFMHMMWSCPSLENYCQEVTREVARIIEREVPHTPEHVLLNMFPHTAKTKVTDKFPDLALMLAKRERTSKWKAPNGLRRLKQELEKWASCEGRIVLRDARRGMGRIKRVQA